ncbi:MAG: hypothetical protein P8J33_14945 [Pirellulaceae bacterium]|nr:hypothetical protein [Pirellulaceae bacterium]
MTVFPVLLLVIFMALLVFNGLGMLRGRGDWSFAFSEVAKRYGGWYRAAGAANNPAAAFRYKNVEARLTCRMMRRRGYRRVTEFRIKTPLGRTKFEILPVKEQPRSRRVKNSPRLLTGDASFDDSLQIFAGYRQNDEVKKQITGAVRWQIIQLQGLLGGTAVTVATEKGMLVITKDKFIKNRQVLDDFVRYCLELFDQLELNNSNGIEFNEEGLTATLGEVRCPICSSDIEGRMVLCVRCKTPHCHDCWQYNGKCGMYACDEVRKTNVSGK